VPEKLFHQTSSQRDRLFRLLDSGTAARQAATVDQTKTKRATAWRRWNTFLISVGFIEQFLQKNDLRNYSVHESKLCSFLSDDGKATDINSIQVLARLRAIAVLIGKEVLGFTELDISLHSIRSGGAMAMFLTGRASREFHIRSFATNGSLRTFSYNQRRNLRRFSRERRTQ